MTFKDLDNSSSAKRNFVLNEETMKGKWKETKGEIQKMWGKLTDDELEQAKGDMTAVSGIIQQRYGESKESVQAKLSDVWTGVKQGVATTAEKAKHAVAEAKESAKKKI
jgi:uncharacterized protein YjbJ (UPF0337 family)